MVEDTKTKGANNQIISGNDGLPEVKLDFVELSSMNGSPPEVVDSKDNKVYTNQIEDDPWQLPDLVDDSVPWKELSTKGKLQRVCINVAKAFGILLLLYLFICSLDFLSSALRLVAGKNATDFLSNLEILRNPVVGLMAGVVATVLLQSSSTSTSILISMVGAKLINIKTSIPIIMGANIGTSVTNTFVSFTQATDRNRFRRAFAAATVHDWFNWITVIVLLPLESLTGYLEHTSASIVGTANWEQNRQLDRAFLSVITKPFTNLIVRLDKKVLQGLAVNATAYADKSLLKTCDKNCYLTMYFGLSDAATGAVILVFALILLITCLIFIVRLLNSVLKGNMAMTIKKVINAEPAFPFNYLIGYLAIVVGCGVTILVQSSSIFTSTLTPLAGIGVVSIERMYPLTLGSNIGTTTTGILAAFASDPQQIKYTLQIAFCHLLFNLSGILLFFPIPFMRFPIPLAKQLGNICADYRWFAVLYLIIMFLLLPIFIFILSYSGPIVFMSVGIPLLAFILLVIVINIAQRKRAGLLPVFLRDWNWLPLWLHSLDPLDRAITSLCCFCKCCERCRPVEEKAHDGRSFAIRPNQSTANILEMSSSSMYEIREINGTDNVAFDAKGSNHQECTQL